MTSSKTYQGRIGGWKEGNNTRRKEGMMEGRK